MKLFNTRDIQPATECTIPELLPEQLDLVSGGEGKGEPVSSEPNHPELTACGPSAVGCDANSHM